MVVLGLGVSHAPPMIRPVEVWPAIYEQLTNGVPQPATAVQETHEVLQGYKNRIEEDRAVLMRKLEAAQVDALVIVGDDQEEVFGPPFQPTFCLYLADEATGSLNLGFIGEPEEENCITLKGHPDLARFLLDALVREGFDLSWSEELRPMGRRGKRGLGHAFTRAFSMLSPDRELPVIILDTNCYFPPLPSGRRCYELGRAIAAALAKRPERVAVCASGGLSHDPLGPRAGWIDEPLDRWVLERLKRADGEALCGLFTHDSDTLRGGTGEIRSWIVTAGACHGIAATVVDYIPVHHAVTGLGFAYWPVESTEGLRGT